MIANNTCNCRKMTSSRLITKHGAPKPKLKDSDSGMTSLYSSQRLFLLLNIKDLHCLRNQHFLTHWINALPVKRASMCESVEFPQFCSEKENLKQSTCSKTCVHNREIIIIYIVVTSLSIVQAWPTRILIYSTVLLTFWLCLVHKLTNRFNIFLINMTVQLSRNV